MSIFSRKKNSDHFDVIAHENEKNVYFTCLSMVHHHEDAQDCTQQTMLKAYKAFHAFDKRASYKTWFYRIAVNVCIDFLRQKKEHTSLETMMEHGKELVDTTQNLYHSLEVKERKQMLHEALSRLPKEVRMMIVLREIQGLSYEEIGVILSLPLGTVKSRMNRARKKLADILERVEEWKSDEPLKNSLTERRKKRSSTGGKVKIIQDEAENPTHFEAFSTNSKKNGTFFKTTRLNERKGD